MLLWVTYPVKCWPLLWTQMPTFLISALFRQVMFRAVIWTLEKQCKKKSWCHMCFSKKVLVIEGHVTERSSRKAWRLPLRVGKGWRHRKHSALEQLLPSRQEITLSLSTPGKTAAQTDRHFTKHKKSLLQPTSPWPRKQMPSKFVMVSIPATCGI